MDWMYLIETTRNSLDELSEQWDQTELGDQLKELAANLDAVLGELQGE